MSHWRQQPKRGYRWSLSGHSQRTRASRFILQINHCLNVSGVYSPSLAKLRLVFHPWNTFLSNTLFSGRDEGGNVKRNMGSHFLLRSITMKPSKQRQPQLLLVFCINDWQQSARSRWSGVIMSEVKI